MVLPFVPHYRRTHVAGRSILKDGVQAQRRLSPTRRLPEPANWKDQAEVPSRSIWPEREKSKRAAPPFMAGGRGGMERIYVLGERNAFSVDRDKNFFSWLGGT